MDQQLQDLELTKPDVLQKVTKGWNNFCLQEKTDQKGG